MPVPHGIKAAREVAAGGSLSASAGSRGGGLTCHVLGGGVRVRFDGPRPPAYRVRRMPSHATTKEIAARSPLSGRPVGLASLFAFRLLGLLLILLAR